MPGGPGPVDAGRSDPADAAQGLGQDGGDAERPGQHLGEPGVGGAGGVGPDEPGVPDLAGCDQADLLGALDLAVDRGVGGVGACRDLGQAEFEIGIAEQQREDLALLLGAQDRQERRGRAVYPLPEEHSSICG